MRLLLAAVERLVGRLRETALSRSDVVIAAELEGGGSRGNHGFTRDEPPVLETGALPVELRPSVRERKCRPAFCRRPSSGWLASSARPRSRGAMCAPAITLSGRA